MKKFKDYQYLDGEMSERDKNETKSKFWNKGKWDTFIVPLLPDNCRDMTFVDMGCNAGLFCKLAEDRGFKTVIGVDSDQDAIVKGVDYRNKINGKYKLIHNEMQDVKLPLADYTIFVNSHYYLNIGDLVPLLDKLRNRTRYCLVVSGNKKTYPHIASSDAESLRSYFKDWHEVRGVYEVDQKGDPSPRNLWTLSFKSPTLERVNMNELDCGNNVQSEFYKELEDGVPYQKTKYYRILHGYRLKKNPESLSVWTPKQLEDFVQGKIHLYENIKHFGLEQAIIVDKSTNKILDGNHRFMMLKHLGYTTILVRKV